MMTNLFSIFDPISSIVLLNLNWLSLGFGFIILPFSFWLIPSYSMMSMKFLSNFFHKEMKLLLSKMYYKGFTMIFISLFFMIILNNTLGLMPYIFTSTTHMLITFSMSMPLWFSFMLFGWFNKPMFMFSHLTPQSTPIFLMSFMIIIEMISNMIRPFTLAIRLTANMIAGHLLLNLLGNQGMFLNNIILLFLLLSQIMLLILESAVAFIQSYVFMILSFLYSSEVH